MMDSTTMQGDGKLSQSAILDWLVSDGRIDREDATRWRHASRSREEVDMHPVNFLASKGLADKKGGVLGLEKLLEWLAERLRVKVFHIDPLKVDVQAVTQVMSFAFAQRHGILAVDVTPLEVVIACCNPQQTDWIKDLEHVVQRPIRQVFADPDAIARYTVEFYQLAKSVRGASGSSAKASGVTNFEQLLELGQLKDPDANDQHIVTIVDWLLQYAFDQRASDIHVEPRRDQAHVRFRIDGVLYTVYDLPAQVATAVISRVKILGRMNVAEKRRPQDGRLKTMSPEGNEIELRLSTLPTAFGEKLVMRIFDPDVLLKSFEELGLANEDYNRWQGMVKKPHGIVLVTGPTGSGKTTTLYSTLKQLATSQVNVCTIEDPIEMVEDAFNQMQVQHNIDLDFAAGVRALLRQDPDIIMVGEIRDLETAEMAVQAALTGHLVIATLHTNDAPSAVTRLMELGVPAYLIKATLLGVMAQRLVRTLCPHCKEAEPVELAAWQELTAPWKVSPPQQVYHQKGCLECRNTGFLGRQGLYEVLLMSPTLGEKMNEKDGMDQLRRQAVKEGMRTLRLSGAQKIAQGQTTIAEVMRVAPPVSGS